MLLTGLIGWPLGHSRSPAMHNAAYVATGIDGVYVLMPVKPGAVAPAIAGLVALGFRGSNVTIPHKEAVIPFLDDLSPAARAIGAVNTIVIAEDGHLFGDNTDAPGFMADLAEQGLAVGDIAAGRALILGAGGSARAVVYALASAMIPTDIWARRPAQAERLIAELKPFLAPTVDLRPLTLRAGQDTAIYRLIVNCTPVGMTPHTAASPWPADLALTSGQVVYDLVYNPPQTLLMTQAQAAGARALNGLGMLVHQGALSWQQWTGRSAPVAAMHAALIDDQ